MVWKYPCDVHVDWLSRSRAASGLAAGSVGAGVLANVFFAASTRAVGATDAVHRDPVVRVGLRGRLGSPSP